MADPAASSATFAKRARKIALLVGEDDFTAAHCPILISVASELAREVVVIGPAAVCQDIERLGRSMVVFDPRATLTNPARDAVTAWKLARILEAENADAVHAVGVRPAVLCGLAFRLVGGCRVLVHLPDIEALAPAGALPRLYNISPARTIGALLRSPSSFLLVECAAGLAELRAKGIDPGARVSVINGPGVDPDAYPLMPPAQGDVPLAACVAPMVASSGIDVLIRAFERAWARGVRMELELAGERTDRAGANAAEEMARWSLHPGVQCTAPPADVRELWRRAEICVLPAVRRQTLARAVLQAAASGRALIVTEFAGGGSFVRDGIEGLVVPPGDVAALGEALERLARDPELRRRLGHAARLRVLQGFTEAHVRETLRGAYLSLLDASSLLTIRV